MSRRLGVFVAHPDDDAFGITSTVALHAEDPEFAFILVLATSGEAGPISDPALATRENLGQVRELEDKNAWRIVGREPDRHEFLRYPDGRVAEVAPQELIDRFAQIMREESPDVVVTFGPEGITGHADHIAVGAAATLAFHLVRDEEGRAHGRGFERLLHLCLPASRLKKFNDEIVARGGEPMDPTQPFQPRGVDDSLVAVVVDGSSVWELKLAALMAHETQAGDMQIPEDAREEALSGEAFVQAWPARSADEQIRSDVFEGL